MKTFKKKIPFQVSLRTPQQITEDNLAILHQQRTSIATQINGLLDTIDEKCRDIKTQLLSIQTELNTMPAFQLISGAEEVRRLNLERNYAQQTVEYERIVCFIEKVRSKQYRNPKLLEILQETAKNMILPRTAQTPTAPPPKTTEWAVIYEQFRAPDKSTYLDELPDLALMEIICHLFDPLDIRSFYIALSGTKTRIEIECVKRLSQVSNSLFLVNCLGKPYCHAPQLCMRCYLHGFGKCYRCQNKVLISDRDSIHTFKCSAMVNTTTEKTCQCKDLRKCHCGESYTSNEECEFRQLIDFHCSAWGDRIGCIHCIKECAHCANVGCGHDNHFRINYGLITSPFWKECEDCKRPHCCAIWNPEYAEWDFRACPTYLTITEPLAPDPPTPTDEHDQNIFYRIFKYFS